MVYLISSVDQESTSLVNIYATYSEIFSVFRQAFFILIMHLQSLNSLKLAQFSTVNFDLERIKSNFWIMLYLISLRYSSCRWNQWKPIWLSAFIIEPKNLKTLLNSDIFSIFSRFMQRQAVFLEYDVKTKASCLNCFLTKLYNSRAFLDLKQTNTTFFMI